ncbi:MAG: hypothetical protein ACXWZL_10005, partial [Mycobacterium sp.]
TRDTRAPRGRVRPNARFRSGTRLRRTRDHLGPWSGRGAIIFGRDGKPHFIHGPHDNPTSIVSRLRRSVGPDDFE